MTSVKAKWFEAFIGGKHYKRRWIYGNGHRIIMPKVHLVCQGPINTRKKTACGLDAVTVTYAGSAMPKLVSDYDPFCGRCARKQLVESALQVQP